MNLSPTTDYTDARGYHYVGCSEFWKKLCLPLPCSSLIRADGYATDIRIVTINGQELVLQLWKGHLNKLCGIREIPGGWGGEVGIYRTIAERGVPSSLSFLPASVRGVLEDLAHRADRLWWPFPELNVPITMTLINTVTGEPFFTADPSEPAGGYWLSRWMQEDSYAQYITDQQGRVPIEATGYQLVCTVGDQTFTW